MFEPGGSGLVAGVRTRRYSTNKCSDHFGRSVPASGGTRAAMVELDLTKRQKEIFDFIGKYAAKTGYPPTVREIGKAVGLHSSSTVHAHLANLEKIGLLRRDPSKPRAIELLFDKAKKTIMPERSGLPLIGHVAAGATILAEENIEEYIEIPDVIGGEEGDYVLRVRGE